MKCQGCGSTLQNQDKDKSGYSEKLTNNYCLRCFKLKNYNVIVPQTIDETKFWELLEELVKKSEKPRIFYYVLDVFDLELSRNLEFEQLLANEKVVILVNKIDLLPKAIKSQKIRKYINQIFTNSDLKNYEIRLVSKARQWSLKNLFQHLEKNAKNDQYFVGHSNVGKSSLINALLKQNSQSTQLLESNNFHTTLNFLPVKFSDDLTIIDTAGINRKESWNYHIEPQENKYLYFQKELVQYTYQIENGQSLVIGGLLILNFKFSTKKKIDLHFYGYQYLNVHRTKTINSQKYLLAHQQELHPKPKQILKSFLEYEPKIDFKSERADLVLSNLGWVNFPNNIDLRIDVQTNVLSEAKNLKKLVQIRKSLI